MKTGVIFGFLVIILIGVLSGVCAEVRINEVMYNPGQCASDTCEYIELYSNEIVNISLIEKAGSSNKTVNLTLEIGYNIITKNNFSFFSIWNISNRAIETDIALADTDNIWLYYNNSLISSLINFESFGAKNNNKSLQFCSGNWTENTPTPGTENNCTIPTPTCAQSFSCSNSSCSSNSFTQNCYNITSNCLSINTTQTFSCTSETTANTYIQLNWTEELFNKEEFEIEVKAINLLDYDYDLKIWIEFKTNSTIISERYDSEGDEWKSGTYYINNFFSGTGNRTKDAQLRIKEDYQNFEGEARIYGKLRRNDNGAIIDDFEKTVLISNKDETIGEDTSDTDTQPITSNSDIDEEEIIVLGSSDIKTTEKTSNSIIYKSKMEYIKDYAPYALSAICIFVIVLLMLDKKR